MSATGVIVRADEENNAETWWDTMRAALPQLQKTDPEVADALRRLEKDGEVELTDPALIGRFDAIVTGLAGWADGPAHAREALTFTPVR